MKILIVEDEPHLRELTRKSLEKERYVVETADDFRSALLKMEDYEYDCILLDLMLPGGSGFSLLKSLKESDRRETPVIILSARDAIEEKVEGLDLGADDYLSKPFHMAELSARIKSVLRRKHRAGNAALEVGNVTVYPDDFRVVVGGKELELGRKEYDILLYFMNRLGRLVDKHALAESIWGDHFDQVDNYDFIYAQIKNLRRKLKEAGATPEIRAVYGFGYKMLLE